MDNEFELDGPRLEWERTQDPRWVWRAIRHCVHYREPLPDWVMSYLNRCAAAIENIEGDYGRALHRALEFPAKSGRKRANAIDMATERFAMAFAKAILDGAEAGKARTDAASAELYAMDDKDLKKRLRDFFGLEELPDRREQWRWKLIIVTWLMHHPGYREGYPDLPVRFDFGPTDENQKAGDLALLKRRWEMRSKK
jgi:hypothetical protein